LYQTFVIQCRKANKKEAGFLESQEQILDENGGEGIGAGWVQDTGERKISFFKLGISKRNNFQILENILKKCFRRTN